MQFIVTWKIWNVKTGKQKNGIIDNICGNKNAGQRQIYREW